VLCALPVADEVSGASPNAWPSGRAGLRANGSEAPCVGIWAEERGDLVPGDVHDELLAQSQAVKAWLPELTAIARLPGPPSARV
jgi:hypothetical protein